VVEGSEDVVTTNRYTVTAVNASTIVNSTTAGEKLLITTAGADFDGINIQALGTQFDFDDDAYVYSGLQCTLSDATVSDFLFGLAGTDTILMAASSSHAVNIAAGFAGFTKLDDATQVYAATYATTSADNSAAACTMDTEKNWFEFFWDRVQLHMYFNAVEVATFTDNLPTVALRPSICFRTGAAAAKTMKIHEWRNFRIEA